MQSAESKAKSAERMAQREYFRINCLSTNRMDVIMAKFRFQDLEIWKLAIEIGDELLDIADELERKHLYKFAEQLRDAALSISNNIAEGSGSVFKKEFQYFLNVARRSTFEDANILIVLNRRKLISNEKLNELLDRLDKECRMITNFKKTL